MDRPTQGFNLPVRHGISCTGNCNSFRTLEINEVLFHTVTTTSLSHQLIALDFWLSNGILVEVWVQLLSLNHPFPHRNPHVAASYSFFRPTKKN
jgi:hypothetical protein